MNERDQQGQVVREEQLKSGVCVYMCMYIWLSPTYKMKACSEFSVICSLNQTAIGYPWLKKNFKNHMSVTGNNPSL